MKKNVPSDPVGGQGRYAEKLALQRRHYTTYEVSDRREGQRQGHGADEHARLRPNLYPFSDCIGGVEDQRAWAGLGGFHQSFNGVKDLALGQDNIAPPSKQKAPSAAQKGEALMMEGTAGVNRGCTPVRSMSKPAAITRRSCGGLLS